MKNLIYTLSIIVAMVFCPQISQAQINLEHTFQNEFVYYKSGYSLYYFSDTLYPNNSFYYTTCVNNTYHVKIYNSDYSINTDQTYTFTPPTGYEVDNIFLSKKMFNTDDNYEFMVSYKKTLYSLYGNDNYKLILYDINRNVLNDFGTGASFYNYLNIQIINNQCKLLLYRYLYDADNNLFVNTEIYSVPGTLTPIQTPGVSVDTVYVTDTIYMTNTIVDTVYVTDTIYIPSGISQPLPSNTQSAYPNPSNSIINLPYKLNQGETSVMRIFNMNGQLIETKRIDYVFDKIMLNVSNYAKGTYIYEVNNVSNRFIVQ